MIVLDISIVITALPKIRHTLGASPRVEPEDAGGAGGVTQVAHQLGGSLGLGILVKRKRDAAAPRLHDLGPAPAISADRAGHVPDGAGAAALA